YCTVERLSFYNRTRLCIYFFFLPIRPPPRPTLFPYTTLFRSRAAPQHHAVPARRAFVGIEPFAHEGVDAVGADQHVAARGRAVRDRKSTRLNSSHVAISYAVFCLKKKNRIK